VQTGTLLSRINSRGCSVSECARRHRNTFSLVDVLLSIDKEDRLILKCKKAVTGFFSIKMHCHKSYPILLTIISNNSFRMCIYANIDFCKSIKIHISLNIVIIHIMFR
jgi:hypothetical protein